MTFSGGMQPLPIQGNPAKKKPANNILLPQMGLGVWVFSCKSFPPVKQLGTQRQEEPLMQCKNFTVLMHTAEWGNMKKVSEDAKNILLIYGIFEFFNKNLKASFYSSSGHPPLCLFLFFFFSQRYWLMLWHPFFVLTEITLRFLLFQRSLSLQFQFNSRFSCLPVVCVCMHILSFLSAPTIK